jgi:5-methyltetrahydrofolate--homocysteine methyltransferase
MAIANPAQNFAGYDEVAADLLRGIEGADLRFIERESKGGGASTTVLDKRSRAGEQAATTADMIRQAVIKGQRDQIKELLKSALDEGKAGKELLDGYLLPAIAEVGNLFDNGRYYLPQLIAGAETMKLAIEYLQPILIDDCDADIVRETIIIATVAGDIHDIGKNLVALMLSNNGCNVIDLGKDVATAEIIAAAKRENADIIALSALMTTTMTEMKNVVDAVKAESLSAKVLIGGAVITAEYAEEIGADGYGKDAAEAVRLVRKMRDKEN